MKIGVIIWAFSFLLLSCDRPECKNTNPIFERYAPESDEYKAELTRQLKNAASDRVTYWIDQYIRKDSTEYMSVYIQGNGICAKGIFDITNANGLGNYKKVKGMSYSGAELKGLQCSIDSTNGRYNFVFEDVGWIAD